MSGYWLERKFKLKEFKGIWLPYEVIKNKSLNDKEKMIYAVIISLSKKQECIVTNSYISIIFNITTTQVSRIINSLKRKGLADVKIIYKQNSKEIAKRIITPINTDINTYKQKSSKPINIDVKDIRKSYNKLYKEDFLVTEVEHKESNRVIINNNKIYDNKKWKYKSERDYSNFDWNSLYTN